MFSSLLHNKSFKKDTSDAGAGGPGLGNLTKDFPVFRTSHVGTETRIIQKVLAIHEFHFRGAFRVARFESGLRITARMQVVIPATIKSTSSFSTMSMASS